jgi:hypothetical protein
MTYLPSASKAFAEFTQAAPNALAVPEAPEAHPPALTDAKPATPPRRGFWRAVFDSIWTARQRQAELEIARYLAMRGDTMTDSDEREIARRLNGRGLYRPL